MKILILGSVALPIPPPLQGGTEWIAYYQAEGLAKLDHKVILFAAHGSQKGDYELVEVGGGDTVSSLAGAALARLTESSRNLRKENVYLAQVIEKLIEMKDEYDLILNNMRGEAVFLPSARALGKPFVNVMHLPIFNELASLFKQYNTPIITISNAQRKDFPDLNYLATVYNCVDTEKYTAPKKYTAPNPPKSPSLQLHSTSRHTEVAYLNTDDPDGKPSDYLPEDYLLMMGSISPHKNQAAAIRIAKKLGMPLVLAGKIGNQAYYDGILKDIDGEQIKWIGELGFEEKLKLYQNAYAFLFPVVWEEPFGLVMIEAMSCGTPVVAFANGAIPEVVVDSKTGFVIENNSEEKMIEAIKKVDKIKRENCRSHVLANFTVEKMVADYEKALRSLL